MKRHVHTALGRFTAFWWSDRGLSALLVLLLATFLFSPLLRSGPASFLGSIFLSLLLLSGVAAISTTWYLRTGAGMVALAAIVLEWMSRLYPGSVPLQTASNVVSLLYFILLTLVVMRHVFQEGPVTSARVQGAVAAYILVGVTWSIIYRLIDVQLPDAFNLTKAAAGQAINVREHELTYFSFVTLTTLGYGDITPAHPIARIFVIIEALIGQLFPATLLARLVSLATMERK